MQYKRLNGWGYGDLISEVVPRPMIQMILAMECIPSRSDGEDDSNTLQILMWSCPLFHTTFKSKCSLHSGTDYTLFTSNSSRKSKIAAVVRMKILVFTTLYPNNTRLHHGVFVKERMSRVARLEGCDLEVIAPVPYFPSIPITRRWRYSQVMHYEQREGIEVY